MKTEKETGAPESAGEPVVTKSGFPAPDALEKEWHDHLSSTGKEKAEGDELFEEWMAFCKQKEYLYPYPYPYPKAGRAQWSEVADIAEALVADEKNADRKAKLQQIATTARQACSGYPYPKKGEEPPKDAEDKETKPTEAAKSADGSEDVEKIGRKMSASRAEKLRRVIDELKALADEVEAGGKDDAKKSDTTVAAAPAPDPTKPAEVAKAEAKTETVSKGTEELVGMITEVAKRLEAIEKVPGLKTSIDGQDTGDGVSKSGSLFRGLV